MTKITTRSIAGLTGLLLAVPAALFAGTAPVPEPSTVLLIGGGLGALILLARRKRGSK